MADGVFNISLAEVKHYSARARDNAGEALTVVLLQANEAQDTLEDYDDLAALLSVAGNTEADFTNYARKEIVGTDITVTVDDTNNRVDIDVPDQRWNNAGGTTDNTLTKLLLVFDPDTSVADDAVMVPLTHADFTPTTDGSDLVAEFDAAGYFRAS